MTYLKEKKLIVHVLDYNFFKFGERFKVSPMFLFISPLEENMRALLCIWVALFTGWLWRWEKYNKGVELCFFFFFFLWALWWYIWSPNQLDKLIKIIPRFKKKIYRQIHKADVLKLGPTSMAGWNGKQRGSLVSQLIELGMQVNRRNSSGSMVELVKPAVKQVGSNLLMNILLK